MLENSLAIANSQTLFILHLLKPVRINFLLAKANIEIIIFTYKQEFVKYYNLLANANILIVFLIHHEFPPALAGG